LFDQLSAWGTITTLPHALESIHGLLVAILQDNPRYTLFSSLQLRQSYATAIIRLVNGLVDPLQLGAYARSIASIAAQLGLPGWLVELRHAATHENLPSLGLLREAAREVQNVPVVLVLPFIFFLLVYDMAPSQLLSADPKFVFRPSISCDTFAPA
jgi:hypothetical protein